MVLFPVLGSKSKSHFKSKAHPKSWKAFKGTKAKSYIHKSLAKRSAEPGLGWSWSRGFYCKGHGKGKSFKGKCRTPNTLGIFEIIRQLPINVVKVNITVKKSKL